jgi:hypothetical protein
MAMRKKLDSIIIKDEFNTAEAQLLEYAVKDAQERAAEMGWTDVDVIKSEALPQTDGVFLIHTYEVLGIAENNQKSLKQV